MTGTQGAGAPGAGAQEASSGPVPPPGVVLRRLGAGDAAAFRALRLLALRTAPEAFGSTWEDERGRPLDAFAARLEGSVVLAAEAEGTLLGVAGLRRDEGPRERHKALVWGMFVRPEARGRGIAAALLEALLRAAPAGVERVRLAATAGNRAAIALYEGAGFVRYGVEPGSLRGPEGEVDEVLLGRQLG